MNNKESKRYESTFQEKSKKSQRFESTFQEVNIVIPPDGGYAWIVVIAAFLSNFVVDGIAFSFSVAVLPKLSESLKLPPSKLTVISSVQLGVYYLVGPVACAFINRYGFRPVGICGSLIAFTGMFVTSHLESFAVVIALYGVIVGIGFGMVYTAVTVCVGYYFEKYRALATGLASCGSSFGGLCLAPVFAYTSEKYGWQFTMKIQAFLTIISIAAAFTMKQLKPTTTVPLTQDIISEMDNLNAPSRVDFVEIYKTDSMVSIDLEDRSEESRHYPQISIISSRYLPISEVKKKKRICCSCSWLRSLGCCSCSRLRNLCPSKLTHANGGTMNVLSTGPMDRKDIFYAASVVHLPEYKLSMKTDEDRESNRRRMISYHLSMILDADKMRSTESSENSTILEFDADTRPCFGLSHMVHKVLGNLFDISLLKSTVFCVLALACFCYSLGYITPYLYIRQRGEINNMPTSFMNWYVSWISVGNMIGRISSGVIATLFPRINVSCLVGFATTVAGISTVISAYIGKDDVGVQIGYCILFGFFIAMFGALRPVVFVNLLGLKKLTNAFGLTAIALGIGLLAGTPIMSGVESFDDTGSLVWTFVLSGSLFIASGMLTILAFFIHLGQQTEK